MQKKLARPYHKLSDVNGSYLRQFYRMLGGQLALSLQKTRITPNMVTIASFVLVLLSLPFIFYRIFPSNIIGSLLLFVSMILDKADGSLARLRKKGTPLGTWLDSTTDFIGIFLLFTTIGFSFYVRKEYVYFALSMISFSMYVASKLVYIYFKKYFGKHADDIIEIEKGKHKLRSSFHVNEVFVNNWIFLFTLTGLYEVGLIILTLYSALFSMAIYALFTRAAIQNNKVYTVEEELDSKF